MTISRRGLADEIDRLDDEINLFQKDKAEIYAAYREQLESDGSTKDAIREEIAGMKLAIRRRRLLSKDEHSVAEKDAKLDEILGEICKPAAKARSFGTDNALRARVRDTGGSGGSTPPATGNPPPAGNPAPAAATAQTSALGVTAGETAPNPDDLDIPPFLRRDGNNQIQQPQPP
jgi:hypothetical protein